MHHGQRDDISWVNVLCCVSHFNLQIMDGSIRWRRNYLRWLRVWRNENESKKQCSNFENDVGESNKGTTSFCAAPYTPQCTQCTSVDDIVIISADYLIRFPFVSVSVVVIPIVFVSQFLSVRAESTAQCNVIVYLVSLPDFYCFCTNFGVSNISSYSKTLPSLMDQWSALLFFLSFPPFHSPSRFRHSPSLAYVPLFVTLFASCMCNLKWIWLHQNEGIRQ